MEADHSLQTGKTRAETDQVCSTRATNKCTKQQVHRKTELLVQQSIIEEAVKACFLTPAQSGRAAQTGKHRMQAENRT